MAIEPLATPTIRSVVLLGEQHPDTPTNPRQLVARSECTFRIDDDETVRRCIEALRDSDDKLRSRPEEMMLWNWEMTTLDTPVGSDQPGGTISLGVSWYDEDFFHANKDAYVDPAHLAAYLDIGLKPGSVTVTHWRFAGTGKY